MSAATPSTTHSYLHTPISIEVYPVDNGKGYWGSNKIVVKYNGNEIGSYVRSYPSFVIATFHPFKLGDEWFALYSEDYTASRVAKLTPTEFVDWCGEEEDGAGFCPTEFWVPMGLKYNTQMTLRGEDKIINLDLWYDSDCKDEAEFLSDIEEVKANPKNSGVQIVWSDFGFLSGCYWGDDSSWKLRYIDLAGIPEKKLIITEKFGYWELSESLRKSIRIDDFGYIRLKGSFSMNTKKPVPNDSFKPGFFGEDA